MSSAMNSNQAYLYNTTTNKKYKLSNRITKIGKDKFLNDIVLPFKSISSQHCLIRKGNEKFFLKNVSFKKEENSCNVNGKHAVQGNEYELSHGDIISFGNEERELSNWKFVFIKSNIDINIDLDVDVDFLKNMKNEKEKENMNEKSFHDKPISLINSIEDSLCNDYYNDNNRKLKNRIEKEREEAGQKEKYSQTNENKEKPKETQTQTNEYQQEKVLHQSYMTFKEDKDHEIKIKYEELLDEYRCMSMKFNALLIHSSSLQKKNDEFEMEIIKTGKELSLLTNSQMGKDVVLKEKIIYSLENEISLLKKDLLVLRNYQLGNGLDQEVNWSGKGREGREGKYEISDNKVVYNSNSNQIKRLSDLLDEYIKENRRLKQVNDSLINYEMICNKKWNEVISENENYKKKIHELYNQMTIQREELNGVIKQLEEKLTASLSIYPKSLLNNNQQVQQDSQKSNAANFLIEQINFFLEERRNAFLQKQFFESENLFLSNQLKGIEEKMKKEGNLENSQSEVQKLKKRVEELEDLNFQLNLNRQEEEKIEYQTAIQQLVFECGVKNEIIEKQKMKLKVYFQNENVNVIDESEMINELIKVMREKDEQIVNLQKEVKGKVVNNIINFDERFNSTRMNYDENEEKYYEKKKDKGMERSVVSYNPNDFIYISSK